MNQQAKPFGLLTAAVLALTLCSPLRAMSQSDSHAETFDSRDVSWRADFYPQSAEPSARVIQHLRESGGWNRKGLVETFRVETRSRNQLARLSGPVAPARPFDDLSLTMRVTSNQGGIRLGLRLIFTDLKHPRTGEPLTAYIRGDTYTHPGKWQDLTCKADHKAVNRALQQLRSALSLPFSVPGHTYVDRAVLFCDFNPGRAFVSMDNLRMGPVIAPERLVSLSEPSKNRGQPPTSRRLNDRIDLRLGQLRVDKQPFFPVVTPWHGESPESLRKAGINTVLIPHGAEPGIIAKLAAAGLQISAIPPPLNSEAFDRTAASADEHVLFWYVGTRIAPRSRKPLADWARQIRRRDPRRRPIMGDIAGSERIFSRHLDMVGLSRPVIGTSLTLHDYRKLLLRRRGLTQPGSFCWTWIPTDPSRTRTRLSSDYMFEPEQIRLMTYAALASGSQAIGFWKQSSLTGNRPADRERRLVMRQLNGEIALIREWLAEGKLTDNVVCEVGASVKGARTGNRVKQAWLTEQQRRQQSWNPMAKSNRPGLTRTNVEAAVLRTPRGDLILPVWYSDSAQFVPGELVASNLSFLHHTSRTQRRAWYVTTTGVRALPVTPEPGGLRIHLSSADGRIVFDQTAVIVVTSQDEVNKLRRRIAETRKASAATWIQLAQAKRERVLSVESELAAVDGRTDRAVHGVDAAIAEAQSALGRDEFDAARRHAARAMQFMRRLQHARWETATRGLSSAAASPHTTSYQTLPAQRALAHRLSTAAPISGRPLLPSTRGSSVPALRQSGWTVGRSEQEDRQVSRLVEFYRTASAQRYGLRLTAAPPTPAAARISSGTVQVSSPVVHLTRGQLVRVRGDVSLPQAIRGDVDGAMVFDSIGGPGLAIRWKKKTDWVPFDIIREVDSDTPFRLTFALRGLGQLRIRNLQIDVYGSQQVDTPRLTKLPFEQ